MRLAKQIVITLGEAEIQPIVDTILDYLEPIPKHIDRVHDSRRATWRRSTDDPGVWTTAGRSLVATSRKLWDTWGPLTWEGHGE